jgi:hypothetical protein
MSRLLLVAALAAWIAGPLAAQEASAPFAVGVWTGEAILPFAAFDGVRWQSSWPASNGDTEPAVPQIGRIPPAWWGPAAFSDRWDLLEPGGRRHGVRLAGTAVAEFHSCDMNVGLTLDGPGRSYERGSIAVSRPGAIDVVTDLESSSPDRNASSRRTRQR